MGKKARVDVGMSNREGCQTPGGQGKLMAQMSVVAMEMVSAGIFKRCHEQKPTALLTGDWPRGASKEKVPRMTPIILAFAIGEVEIPFTNKANARGGPGFGEKTTCSLLDTLSLRCL